jgi:hypothetical protein
MPKLYEIAAEFRALANAIDDAGGELSPEAEAQLTALTGTLEEKTAGVLAVIRERRAEAAGFKAEADRLAARAKAEENAADRLQAYLLEQLTAAGVDAVNAGTVGKVKVMNASRPSIAWDGPPASIPQPFRKVEYKLDGTAAYDAWKAGSLPAGFVAKLTRFLRIW